MTDLIEVKTADLTGRALDWAVAAAEGLDVVLQQIGDSLNAMAIKGSPAVTRHGRRQPVKPWNPTTNWEQTGPLIEKHMLNIRPHVTRNGVVTSWASGMTWPCATMPEQAGATMLVAACRAIVMKQAGDTVQVPKELMP